MNDDVEMEPTVPEVPPMDVLLLSDFLRFHLDGDMEMDRGIVDCYDGLCVQTDGERILINLPEFYVFAGHHDEHISAHEDTIEERNGIMIGDVSAGEKPDIPGVAVDRSITGWGAGANTLVSMRCTMIMFATTGRNGLWRRVSAVTAVRRILAAKI